MAWILNYLYTVFICTVHYINVSKNVIKVLYLMANEKA